VSLPDRAGLDTALEDTWPAAGLRRSGPFLLRDGAGGGRRVSAATAEAPAGPADIAALETHFRAAGAPCLLRLRPDLHPFDADLDAALAARGYALEAPTLLYAAPAAALGSEPVPAMKAFAIWPALAIQREIWAAAGLGPERLAVMDRAAGPRTTLLAREADRVAGTAFVAVSGRVGMLHALEIDPRLRRRGAGGRLARAAAVWAGEQGATWLALAVVAGNAAARGLWEGLGMAVAGRYHYRIAPDPLP
jgi:GNAT superfamily N-acetyltransferase